jgi:hypothetical protein
MVSLSYTRSRFCAKIGRSVFASPTTAPVLIGASYFVVITAYAPQSVSVRIDEHDGCSFMLILFLQLNTARDLGGRLAAACIWGRGVFPAGYTTLCALTNILATLLAGFFQIMILSDSTRPQVHGELFSISRRPVFSTDDA